MQRLFLIKYGEIALKGKNRRQFENRLVRNIRYKLKEIPFEISNITGRLYISANKVYNSKISQALKQVLGIVSFVKAIKVEKNIEAITKAAHTLAKELQLSFGHSFKIESRRTDKSFALNSYEIACQLGDYLKQELPKLKVDVNNPSWILNIEIREHAYLYGPEEKGLNGLPVGANGRGFLLLSGGIDSPVAGFFMGKRGLIVDAVYFHTHPYTSPQAKEKVKTIARLLSSFIPRLKPFIVDFTAVQMAIKENASNPAITLMARASMMRIACMLAEKHEALCIITGESLGQVASQTPESLRFTGSYSALPVFRPLIGMDKEEIIQIAKKIGTYELSIQPFPDCCTLFAPQHPLIKPDFTAMQKEFNKLDLDKLILKASHTFEFIEF